MKRKLAIVLLSGGMDSCVCAAIAHRQYELAFLHISYGQLTESQELNSFHKLSKFYKIEKLFICKIDSLRQIGGSSLTDSSISVEKIASNFDKPIYVTVMPSKNDEILVVEQKGIIKMIKNKFSLIL